MHEDGPQGYPHPQVTQSLHSGPLCLANSAQVSKIAPSGHRKQPAPSIAYLLYMQSVAAIKRSSSASCTYVLVHGAYHGGWCYAKVVPLLEAAGHTIVAVDLPGHGDNPVPREEITLAAYVRHVCSVIDDLQAGPEGVILVGHSLGGVSISQVAEDRPEKVKTLVFLAALMPRHGESRRDLSVRLNESSATTEAREQTADGLAYSVRAEYVKPFFYGLCSDEDIGAARLRLVPQASEVATAAVSLSAARYGAVPRVYIECLRDAAIPIDIQRRMVASLPCERVLSLDTDHSPFFSAPQELAAHLLSLAL